MIIGLDYKEGFVCHNDAHVSNSMYAMDLF